MAAFTRGPGKQRDQTPERSKLPVDLKESEISEVAMRRCVLRIPGLDLAWLTGPGSNLPGSQDWSRAPVISF